MGSFFYGIKVLFGSRSIWRYLVSLIVGLLIGFNFAKLFVFTSQAQNRSIISEDLWNEVQPGCDVGLRQHGYENTNVARNMYNEVRVLCWIMTNPENHHTKALHVKRTWGTRCNKLIFMSSTEDAELGSVALPVNEGRDNLWAKTKEAYKYIYEHHMEDADWFLKADDDTYTIVENLRYLLYPYSSETPIYFGCKYKSHVEQGYMSGGAGYVLSREAVRRFVVEAIPNATLCYQENGGAEDVEIGKCLANVNVIAGDSRDSNGRGRFFPLSVEYHVVSPPDKDFWYWDYIYYKTKEGFMSDNAISFHYVTPDQMYTLDYLIYHLRPYGIVNMPEELPEKLKVGETMPSPTEPILDSTEPSTNQTV